MDNKKVKNILNELYTLDPELAKYEKEIKKIIEDYLKAKPDTKFDGKFALELREKVLARAKELKTKELEKNSSNNMLAYFFRFSYATVGIAMLLLLLVSWSAVYNKNKSGLKPTLNLSAGIIKVPDSAFGHLALNVNNQTKKESDLALGAGSTPVVSMAAPTIVRQTYQADEASSGIASQAADANAIADKRISMPYPADTERINYEYIYRGEDFNITEDKMPVYKKASSDIASREFVRYLSEFKIDSLNLNKFSRANLDNLTMSENQEFGYTLSINFQEGTIDVYSNWQQWPHPENNCRDEKCYAQYRLSMNDVPADEKIVDIANQFINDYGIDASHYGQPYIQKNWQKFYGIATDNAEIYIPEEITVIYPLVLDGKTLHDESGYPNGLYVTVNIRQNRVAGVRPITPYNYISSDYEVATDREKIKEYTKRGGLYQSYQHPGPTKTVEIELNAPEEGLVRYWNYNQDTGQGEELYIPALIFPIAKTTDDAKKIYNDYIVVPLVKEIMEKQQNDVIGVPVPLLERGQSGMSGVSTGAADAVK